MSTVPIRTARERLSEIVDHTIETREPVMITRNGVPAAVLVSSEEWGALQETLSWLSQGAERDVREGMAAYEAGETLSVEPFRASYASYKVTISEVTIISDSKPLGVILVRF